MDNWLINFLVFGILMAPAMAIVAAVLLYKRYERKRQRRSPLTSELLRPPAYGVMDRLEELRWDLGSIILGSALLPAMLAAAYLAQTVFGRPIGWQTMAIMAVAILLPVFIYAIVRSIQLAKQIRTYREGRDGELATAQLLEPIIAGGGRVLHDIQAPGFNIDHVAVAPGGVFAIETKHRLKPTTGRGTDNAKVTFDGKALRFPDWTDTTTADQAAAQARWLSERLTRSTGLIVKARPIIALPGWYVENTNRGEVWAMNPKTCGFMLKPSRGEAPLSQEAMQRITYQVEQLCRLPDPNNRRGGGDAGQR